jgi:hypothetical protein
MGYFLEEEAAGAERLPTLRVKGKGNFVPVLN